MEELEQFKIRNTDIIPKNKQEERWTFTGRKKTPQLLKTALNKNQMVIEFEDFVQCSLY